VDSSLDLACQLVKPGKTTQTIGILAEALVAKWLMGQGWEILQHRWHCRWGELDLIAKGAIASTTREATPQPVLAFVEVKARGRGNWDENGLLSITPQKQAKLWQAAQLFLAERTDLAELPCRFDVALVSYGRSPLPIAKKSNSTTAEDSTNTVHQQISNVIFSPVTLGQPVLTSGYRLSLQQYIQSAFD
jgi:putative endonuclease